jgi:hypothetical protein
VAAVAAVKDLGPLDWRTPIVDASGRPSPQFQRLWNTQRNNNALIGTITFGTGAPTGVPDDGALYMDTTKLPWVLYVGDLMIWNIVGVQDFTQLADVPGNYTSAANDLVTVNGNATGLVFSGLSAVLDQVTITEGSLLVRGNATWGGLAPGNATQVLTANGAGALPSWQAGGGGGGGGGGTPVDGNPVTLPALSTLTWLNQGPATAVQHTNGPISITAPAAGNFEMRGLQASVPGSTPWTLTTKLSSLLWNYQYNIIGVYVIDGSDKLFSNELLFNSNILQVSHWNSATSYSNPSTTFSIIPKAMSWFRINNDGTSFNCMLSENGADWVTYFSESNTAFIGAPVAAGVYVHNSGISLPNVESIWSFELVTGAGTDSTW